VRRAPLIRGEYRPNVPIRINFARRRIYPAIQVSASAGPDIYKSEPFTLRVQVDGQNLNNFLNLLDFGSFLSGNANRASAQLRPSLDSQLLALKAALSPRMDDPRLD